MNEKNSVKKITDFSVDISTPTKKLIEESAIIIGTYSSSYRWDTFKKKNIFPKFLLPIESKFEIFYEKYNFANTFQNINDIVTL